VNFLVGERCGQIGKNQGRPAVVPAQRCLAGLPAFRGGGAANFATTTAWAFQPTRLPGNARNPAGVHRVRFSRSVSHDSVDTRPVQANEAAAPSGNISRCRSVPERWLTSYMMIKLWFTILIKLPDGTNCNGFRKSTQHQPGFGIEPRFFTNQTRKQPRVVRTVNVPNANISFAPNTVFGAVFNVENIAGFQRTCH